MYGHQQKLRQGEGSDTEEAHAIEIEDIDPFIISFLFAGMLVSLRLLAASR